MVAFFLVNTNKVLNYDFESCLSMRPCQEAPTELKTRNTGNYDKLALKTGTKHV